MINKRQLRDLIERVLIKYDLHSDEAVNLVYGTISQESVRGTYLRQRSKGIFNINRHGLGIAQIEKATFDYLAKKYFYRIPTHISFEELEWNLEYSILFCRLKYLSIPEPIPRDIRKQSEYWDKYYNANGVNDVEQYLENYYR